MTAPRFHRLSIREVRPETADAISVAFEVPPALREEYRFVQGQFITLRETIDGEELRTIIEASIGTPQLVPGTEAERRVPVATAPNTAPPLPVAHTLPRPAAADAPQTGLGPADISG